MNPFLNILDTVCLTFGACLIPFNVSSYQDTVRPSSIDMLSIYIDTNTDISLKHNLGRLKRSEYQP
jgi:hypothetical protein